MCRAMVVEDHPGEHTAPCYRRVTMDGAVVSGERAAAEILAALA